MFYSGSPVVDGDGFVGPTETYRKPINMFAQKSFSSL